MIRNQEHRRCVWIGTNILVSHECSKVCNRFINYVFDTTNNFCYFLNNRVLVRMRRVGLTQVKLSLSGWEMLIIKPYRKLIVRSVVPVWYQTFLYLLRLISNWWDSDKIKDDVIAHLSYQLGTQQEITGYLEMIVMMYLYVVWANHLFLGLVYQNYLLYIIYYNATSQTY